MYKIFVVARTTAHESLRQPLFYILVGTFAALIWASQFFTMFTLDETLEAYLLREMGLSSIALGCGLLAVLLSWLVITREMEKLTALTVLSKPVTRAQFLLGKYLGILSAVTFAAAPLAATLIVTLWQKDAGPKFGKLTDIERAAMFDWGHDEIAEIVAVEPAPDTAAAVVVTLARPLRERTGPLARLARVPENGAWAGGSLFVWRDRESLEWNVLRSWNEGGRSRALLQLDWRAPDAVGRPHHAPHDPARAAAAPRAGEEARLTPRNFGAAQAHLVDFWGEEVPRLVKGTILAVLRVAVLLAFAAVLAPHVSLVVNSAVCFLLFLLGHVSNYAFLALTGEGRGFLSRAVGRIFYALLPNLENFRVESLVAAGRPITMSYVLSCAAYGIAYTAVVLAAGTAVFSRKEIR